MWKRGAPYTPSRSSSAMAGIPRSQQAVTRSSGTEAPCKKLNAERAWSSTYALVIAALHEPAPLLAIDAIERAIAQRHVPFIARPRIGSPPISGSAPRSRTGNYVPADSFRLYMHRLPGGHLDAGGTRRTDGTEGKRGGEGASGRPPLRRRGGERALQHFKCSGAVGVQERWGAYVFVAYQ